MEWCFCAGYCEVLSLVFSQKVKHFYLDENHHIESILSKDLQEFDISSVSKFYGEYQHWEKAVAVY